MNKLSTSQQGLPRIDPRSEWLLDVRRVESPNCDARPPGEEISLLVIHGISLPPGKFGGGYIDQLFSNTLNPAAHPYFASIAGNRVSAHVLIDRHGEITQYVSFRDRAWHAGVSEFCGRPKCNDYSIGIELEGCDEQPYTDAQYEQLADLTLTLMAAIPVITMDRIAGHSEISPGRKTDPGPLFDWPRYRQRLTNRNTTA